MLLNSVPVHAASADVPMHATPNPAVQGQIVVYWIDFGPFCPYGQGFMSVYAVQGTGLGPYTTVDLGRMGIPAEPARVGQLYSHVQLPAGVWRVSADGHCTVQINYPDFYVHGIEISLTIKPKPAAPPRAAPAPPQVKSAPPSPPIVIRPVHLQSFAIVPGHAGFHTVAVLRQPSTPAVPPGGAFGALVAAAVAATVGALWRRRSRQHR